MFTRVFGVPVAALVVELVVWNEKLAGVGVSGTMPQAVAAGPVLMIVANAVAVVPT
jgi:hypothetical protein